MESEISNYAFNLAKSLVLQAVLTVEPQVRFGELESDSEEEIAWASVGVQVNLFEDLLQTKERVISDLRAELAAAYHQLSLLQERSMNSAKNFHTDSESSFHRVRKKSAQPLTSNRVSQTRKSIEPKRSTPKHGLPPLPTSPRRSSSRAKPITLDTKRSNKSVSSQKPTNLLDDLLFGEQSKQEWDSFYNNIKENPALLSTLLEKPKPPTRPRPLSRTRKLRTQASRDSSLLEYSRPVSSRQRQLLKRQVFKQPKDMDWAVSVLDSDYVPEPALSLEVAQSYLTSLQNQTLDTDELPSVYEQCVSALKILRAQLGLAEAPPSPCSKTTTEHLLQTVCSLLEARHLTVRILELVHQREKLVMQLMTDSEATGVHNRIVWVTEEVERKLSEWQDSDLPYENFVYLGQNLSNKMTEDLGRIATMYQTVYADL